MSEHPAPDEYWYPNSVVHDWLAEKRAATERMQQLLTWVKRSGHLSGCNYHMKFHARSGYVCDCGLEDLLGYQWDPENEDTHE